MVNVVVVEEENSGNVVVEGKPQKCGSGGGGKQWKCGGGGGKLQNLWPSNLYQCLTCYLFLSLHSAPVELT